MADMTTGQRGGSSNRMPPCFSATESRRNEKMIGFSEKSKDTSVWFSGQYEIMSEQWTCEM